MHHPPHSLRNSLSPLLLPLLAPSHSRQVRRPNSRPLHHARLRPRPIQLRHHPDHQNRLRRLLQPWKLHQTPSLPPGWQRSRRPSPLKRHHLLHLLPVQPLHLRSKVLRNNNSHTPMVLPRRFHRNRHSPLPRSRPRNRRRDSSRVNPRFPRLLHPPERRTPGRERGLLHPETEPHHGGDCLVQDFGERQVGTVRCGGCWG